ncbi:succinyldiaminopimelate transaminase [Isoptericola sp. b441]|uniref:Aminotransferase n=1 Tax=Actinotalea lenta TaxID=3064654 RepID=A0ABT9D8U6_9CELL|nr:MULTISPECIES: succinyldiaminopimelate transaminase [unclassified Isoptericola]MDO8106881.1 succinyldiaminopimelate transaminase [Isoptericola sp. b441]MDO8121409.1 succinyldiaminopimelate transaminase [Isoptericola sp. b490]
MGLLVGDLPDFPWDTLAAQAARARAHPEGLVDLSVGTPVDPTPPRLTAALAAAADAPGYPATHGTAELRAAVARWFDRRRGVPDVEPEAVLPTVGSKELVALLPSLLGLGPGDVVVHPRVAYPTYDVGARLAGARPVPADEVADWPDGTRLVWLNSPSNPTGTVLGVEALAAVVTAARERGAVVASDECYAMLPWTAPWSSSGVPSILDPRVAGGSHDGLLALYSLSKQSNLAGYRAAFVAGDPALVGGLLQARKHIGMMVPGPVQQVMLEALDDDEHVAVQRERYARRRAALVGAFRQAGYRVEPSPAGLYLWVRADGQDGWATVADLAAQGILVAPGSFYGAAGAQHVRAALTATDEAVARAVARLSGA